MAQRISISGFIIDSESFEDLSGVHIYSHKHIGTASDINGRFNIKVNFLDTLHFTRVGYDSLAIIITDINKNQSPIISMKKSITVLDNVNINAVYQANTIIKKAPQGAPIILPGIRYPSKPYEEDYHMGLQALSSPITAIYRMFSKRYKEEKKNYKLQKQWKKEDAVFVKASNNLSAVLQMTDEYLDEYFYRDFIEHSGLTMRFLAESNEYEILQVLPRAIETYHKYLKATEENRDSTSFETKNK